VRFYEFIILLFDYKVKIEQDNSYNIKKILMNAGSYNIIKIKLSTIYSG